MSKKIIEVFDDNFLEEIKRLSSYLDKYNFVSMDTEFPGMVYGVNHYTKDFYYKTIKMNVDNLKLIQVGITLCDEMGRYPCETSTWQFNLKFNIEKDKYSYESISLLTNSGINFDMLNSKGIEFDLFAEYLITSGLLLNDDIHWISFHGSYDFAYLLKLCNGNPNLPESEEVFLNELELYFKNFYDIRILLKNLDNFKGSLNKIAQELEIVRIGTTHQAGSDSIVTQEVFFRLFKRSHLNHEHLKMSRNVLFGLGDGSDDYEILQYNNFSHIVSSVNNLNMNSGGANNYTNFSMGNNNVNNVITSGNSAYSNNINNNINSNSTNANNNNNKAKNVPLNPYYAYNHNVKSNSQSNQHLNMNVLYNYTAMNGNKNPVYTHNNYHLYTGVVGHYANTNNVVNVLNSGMLNNNMNSNINSNSNLNMNTNMNTLNSVNTTKEKKKIFGKVVSIEAYSN